MNERYSCAFSGRCEFDMQGEFGSFTECVDECQGIDDKDTTYLIYEYDPGSAVYLAPSDRLEVIRRLIGLDVAPDESIEVLEALGSGDIKSLIQVPALAEHVREYYSWEEIEPHLPFYAKFIRGDSRLRILDRRFDPSRKQRGKLCENQSKADLISLLLDLDLRAPSVHLPEMSVIRTAIRQVEDCGKLPKSNDETAKYIYEWIQQKREFMCNSLEEELLYRGWVQSS
jgi:hypothetical protein